VRPWLASAGIWDRKLEARPRIDARYQPRLDPRTRLAG
jgi:hypothetical protein